MSFYRPNHWISQRIRNINENISRAVIHLALRSGLNQGEILILIDQYLVGMPNKAKRDEARAGLFARRLPIETIAEVLGIPLDEA